jgi:hypothetical protein
VGGQTSQRPEGSRPVAAAVWPVVVRFHLLARAEVDALHAQTIDSALDKLAALGANAAVPALEQGHGGPGRLAP